MTVAQTDRGQILNLSRRQLLATPDTTTRLWVRVWEPAKYCLLVSDSPIPRDGKPTLSMGSAKPAASLQTKNGIIPLSGSSYSATIDFSTDLTAVFEVTSLKPGTQYFYAVFTNEDQPNNWEIPPDDKLRKFRTRPLNPDRVTFGLYSCHMPYTGSGNVANTQMWENFTRELEDYSSDFVIGGGDQVYTDGNSRVSIWRWLKKVKADKAERRHPG